MQSLTPLDWRGSVHSGDSRDYVGNSVSQKGGHFFGCTVLCGQRLLIKGQPSKLSEKKSINPLKLSFQGKGEVFTEGEKETALYRNLSQRD